MYLNAEREEKLLLIQWLISATPPEFSHLEGTSTAHEIQFFVTKKFRRTDDLIRLKIFAQNSSSSCSGVVLAYFTVSVKLTGPRVEVVAEMVTVPAVDPVV